jgi:hypothetical protein
MRQPSDNAPRHQCCPKAWRQTPDMTGDYDFDASIMHSGNRDMASKLRQHLKRPRSAYDVTGPTR